MQRYELILINFNEISVIFHYRSLFSNLHIVLSNPITTPIKRKKKTELSYETRPATLFKKRLWQRCFPVNFAKFLRAPFFIEHLWWLLLKPWICYIRFNFFNLWKFFTWVDHIQNQKKWVSLLKNVKNRIIFIWKWNFFQDFDRVAIFTKNNHFFVRILPSAVLTQLVGY